MMRSFLGSQQLKLQSLRTSEVGTKLECHADRIGGRSWSTENSLTHLRRDSLTQLSGKIKNFSELHEGKKI